MAGASEPNGGRSPSPDALLELATREGRGKLKVFLGMAPGVGKTYAMLSAARQQQSDGVDVLIGIVETHGRAETEAMVAGLAVLPRRAVTYRDRSLTEFDVEAAISRRPQLLLVDELAHTNAPGLLHPKRYQDVDEVLRAGIDVWTTLNIQHLESLSDVVQRITGITVRETVPDQVLEKADEVVIVDLPPEDLIQRLKEGKVYLPDNARQAIDRFFKASNLTALRELALRRAADRVDEQMLAQLRQQGIEGPWPTAERLLVCIGGDELSETVVKSAARMAAALKSDWTALHASRSDVEEKDPQSVRRLEASLRLAARLGATTERLVARDLTADILNYAKRNNVTQIVVGRSSGGWLARHRGNSLPDQLVHRAEGLSITVVSPDRKSPARPLLRLPSTGEAISGSLAAAIGVGLAVVVGRLLEQLTTLPNLSMVFLFAVLLCALQFGVWSAISAAVLSFFAYNFFFIHPRYTFTIAEAYELFSLLIFLVVAIVTGGLAGRLREHARTIRERAEATQSLFDFSRKLSAAPKLEDVIWLLGTQAAATAKGASVLLFPAEGDLVIRGGWPPEDQLSPADFAAARWCFKERAPAGRGTDTLPNARFEFRPIATAKSVLAVIGFASTDADVVLPGAADRALQSIIEQSAIAIERTQLVDEAARAATAAEGERLRAALLSSISHDLKTPLASIVGSATSLRSLGERMTAADRVDLLATIEEEASRLSRFVTNLLDMTQLEAGAIAVRHDWVDVGDVVRGAVARASRSFPRRRHQVAVSADLPLVRGDATLLEQVIFNLLDNSNKYADAASTTEITAGLADNRVLLAVSDHGIGIPPEALEKVFEKFYRVTGHDGRAPGTGLGLSICAGLVRAMGGAIRAESPLDGGHGTRVTIALPAGPPPGNGANAEVVVA